jgi:hypothetical protein
MVKNAHVCGNPVARAPASRTSYTARVKIDVVLHSLPGDKRAGELARVVHQLYHDRRRVIVWVADDGRRQILDDFLWTFNKLAFVPHRMWGSSLGPADDPRLHRSLGRGG